MEKIKPGQLYIGKCLTLYRINSIENNNITYTYRKVYDTDKDLKTSIISTKFIEILFREPQEIFLLNTKNI